MSEPKTEQPAPAGPLVLKVGCVADGKYYAAGEPIPFDAETLPDTLRPYLAADDAAPEPPGPPGIRFEPGVIYNVDDRGAILTRHGAREAARLANAAAAQAQAEEEARAAGTLDPETEAMLRREHEFHISGQILSAEIRARNADAVIAAQDEGAGAEEKPAATLFVRRGAIFRRAEEAKLRPGEPVFVKEPSGAWAAVGVVAANAGLPEVTIL